MKISLKEKYGKTALIAGASEGIGAAFADRLASEGMDLVLIARRLEPLEKFALTLKKYPVAVSCVSCDLSDEDSVSQVRDSLKGREISMLVYNAALSHIGPFIANTAEKHARMARVNMITPVSLLHEFGERMLEQGKGAVILMASLAGFQGSGFISMYAATKAFNRVLAESLWYEWKSKGVDVIACCAGSTATPGFINSNPEKKPFFAPRVQSPEEVARECLDKLGKQPSFISGRGNRVASFIMQKLMSRKKAITVMGDNTKKMYRL